MDITKVQKLVNEKYPGVELNSVVQGWFYLGEHEKGIEFYHRLKQPAPEDDRWLGDCYLITRKFMEAEAVLYRAITRGDEAARIPLARVLSFLDRDTDSLRELNQTDPEQLNVADKVLWYRAQSIQVEHESNINKAAELAEEAWRLVQGIPEFPLYAHWVLLRLGRLHSQTGRAQRALWCFDRAEELLDTSPPHLQLSRAEMLISLGRHKETLEILHSVRDSQPDEQLGFVSLLLEANAAWAVGDVKKAIEHFDKVVEITTHKEVGHEELLARLALAALRGSRDALETAYVHLMRADFLRNSTQDHLNYRFRDTLLKYWARAYNAKQAANELEVLVSEFGQMGLLQEQGWVRLHLAEMYRVIGDERWYSELDTLKGLSVVLQNKAFLAREWVLAPELREAALLTHPEIAGKAPVVLEVYTMGTEKLVLGGQAVSIRLRRGCEVLAYFLEHQEASLKQILVDIFGDEEPKTARIYFHQFRHELADRVPGLSVDYDADAKLYRLNSEVDILWDVAELRAGRKMGEHGIFLPGSGSDWAQTLDQELEPLRNRPSPLLNSKTSKAVPSVELE